MNVKGLGLIDEGPSVSCLLQYVLLTNLPNGFVKIADFLGDYLKKLKFKTRK